MASFFQSYREQQRRANINSGIDAILNSARDATPNQLPALSNDPLLQKLDSKLPELVEAVNKSLKQLYDFKQTNDYDNYPHYRDELKANLERFNDRLAIYKSVIFSEKKFSEFLAHHKFDISSKAKFAEFLDQFKKLYKKVEDQYPFYKKGPLILERLSLEARNELEKRTSMYEYDRYGQREPLLNQQGDAQLNPSEEAWAKAMEQFLKKEWKEPKVEYRTAFLNTKQSSRLYTFQSPAAKSVFTNLLKQAVAEEERKKLENQTGVTIGSPPSAPEKTEEGAVSATTSYQR